MLKVDKMEIFVPWMIRSTELVTKNGVGKNGKNGKIAHGSFKGRPSSKSMAQFGEHVLYRLLEAPNTDEKKIENKMREGVWPGGTHTHTHIYIYIYIYISR